MSLTDLVIIYFACGAPFGVHQLMRKDRSGRVDWVKVAASFVMWPASAIVLTVNGADEPAKRSDLHRDNYVDQIRRQIESLAFGDGETSELFEFREVYCRFSGLWEVQKPNLATQITGELANVSDHPNQALGSLCLARRNGERLAFHRVRASGEFVDLIDKLAVTGSNRSEIVGLAIELADFLGDDATATDLTTLKIIASEPTLAWDGIVQISKPRSTSNVGG